MILYTVPKEALEFKIRVRLHLVLTEFDEFPLFCQVVSVLCFILQSIYGADGTSHLSFFELHLDMFELFRLNVYLQFRKVFVGKHPVCRVLWNRL